MASFPVTCFLVIVRNYSFNFVREISNRFKNRVIFYIYTIRD